MEDNPNRAEAERLLGIAEKLLESRDLHGSREFAVLAQEAEPLIDGSDQILAVVDVLLAAENRVGNHPDWYRILQIDPHTSSSDTDLIKQQYRRFALLLHPDKNRLPCADQAFRFVADAWVVLSSAPKKAQFDSELNLFFTKVDLNKSNRREKEKLPQRRMMATFWTACPYCYGLFEYPRVYEECCVRCESCKRAFHAASIAQLPPLVPGRDEYYCCWGFFPMGFGSGREGVGASGVSPMADTSKFPDWMPPMFPSGPAAATANGAGSLNGSGRGRGAVERDSGAVNIPEAGNGVQKKRGRGRPRKNPLP